jgi:hypothetical protein
MRVLVGFPCLDFVAPEFTLALANIVAFATGHGVEAVVKMAAGSKPEDARIYLARQAIANQCDYLFMVDADIWAPPIALSRLLSASKPIVGATYCTKDGQNRVLGFECSKRPINTADASLREVEMIPGGLSLTRTDLFTKLAMPWFSSPYDAASDRHTDEFYFFCNLARPVAGNPWLDGALSKELGHWGSTEHRVRAN